MPSIKRNAGSDFEHGSGSKKACVFPVICEMPSRGITIRTRPSKDQSTVSRAHHMVTRGMTTRYSTAAVLNTYELLEAIILELPMQQILDIRRVSKTWKAIIDRSKPLRTKLFLEPETSKCLWVMDRRSLHLRPYEWGARERLGERWMQNQAVSRPSVANPLLFKHDDALRSSLRRRALICEGLNFTASPDLTKQESNSIVHKMFVTQPPVFAVQFTFYFHATKQPGKGYRRADGHRTVEIVQAKGVKFGHIIQAFRYEASRIAEFRLSSRLSIKVNSSSPACKSVLYMLGSVFVDEEEKAYVETFREKPVVEKVSAEPAWVASVLTLKG